MKRSEQKKDLRAKSPDALAELVAEKQDELLKLRFKKASSQLEQTGQLKQIRRSIARAKTIIKQKQLQA